jgi:hypothetical protein
MALWWLWVALRGLRAWLSPPASGGCPKLHSSRIHRHWPVRVKAAQKYGFEYSFDRSKDNCASRHAFARGSPERQRRMNSVINWLVALSLTFQWLASTVCAPAMRKARRNDITPSPIFTSPVPLSQALRMTSSVPSKFNLIPR